MMWSGTKTAAAALHGRGWFSRPTALDPRIVNAESIPASQSVVLLLQIQVVTTAVRKPNRQRGHEATKGVRPAVSLWRRDVARCRPYKQFKQ